MTDEQREQLRIELDQETEFAPRLIEKFEPSRRLQQKRLDKLARRLDWWRWGVISDAV